jgi:hypothetical protein
MTPRCGPNQGLSTRWLAWQKARRAWSAGRPTWLAACVYGIMWVWHSGPEASMPKMSAFGIIVARIGACLGLSGFRPRNARGGDLPWRANKIGAGARKRDLTRRGSWPFASPLPTNLDAFRAATIRSFSTPKRISLVPCHRQPCNGFSSKPCLRTARLRRSFTLIAVRVSPFPTRPDRLCPRTAFHCGIPQSTNILPLATKRDE